MEYVLYTDIYVKRGEKLPSIFHKLLYPFLGYLLIMNFISIMATVIDKKRAKRGKWRIPENTLMALALLGGAGGMWIAMKLIHHKTKHKKFMWGLPVILLFQILLVFLFLNHILPR